MWFKKTKACRITNYFVIRFHPKCCCPFTPLNLYSALFPQAHCPLLSFPRRPPAGAAEPGEDRPAGAGEGALAPGGPAGEGAVGKGEPAHCRPGSAARGGSRRKSKLAGSCSQHARTEPWGGRERAAESCGERDDAVHQPGTVPPLAAVLVSFRLQRKFSAHGAHWCLICFNKGRIIVLFS